MGGTQSVRESHSPKPVGPPNRTARPRGYRREGAAPAERAWHHRSAAHLHYTAAMSDAPHQSGSVESPAGTIADLLPEPLAPFAAVTRLDVELAPYTWLKVGGPAQFMIEPRTRDELREVVAACDRGGIPVRVLGGGSNLLVRDDGVPGVVLRLTAEPFRQVAVDGTEIVAGAGALLSHVVSESVAAGLGGLETLVGIPGTVGGAIRGNAGSRQGEISQFVRSVQVMTAAGEIETRQAEEIGFAYRESGLSDLLVLEARLSLREESAEQVSQRMRKLWIMKKESQPFSSQSAGCIFKNPRGLSAGALIEKAGLKGTSVGEVTISDRHANFLVTEPGATAAQVTQLIELIQTRVRDSHGVELEPEIVVW